MTTFDTPRATSALTTPAPATASEGAGMHFQTRDLGVYSAPEPTAESAGATSRATRAATDAATRADTADARGVGGGDAHRARHGRADRASATSPQVEANFEEKTSMTTSIPTPEALRHRASARRWALVLMVVFTVASMAANVVTVTRRGGAIEDQALAGFAPAVLACMGHLLAQFVQAAMQASGVTRRVYGASIVAVSVIGGGAFIVSFENLQSLAARQHSWFVAGVFPVMLDLAILVSTGIHVVIGIANEHDQAAGVEPHRGWLARRFGWGTAAPAVLQPVPAEVPVQELVTSAPQPVTPVTEQLTALDAQLTTAADEVITTPIATAQRGEQQPVTSDNDADDHPAEPATHQDAQAMVTGAQVVGDEQLPSAQPESTAVTTAQLPNAAATDEQSAGEQQIDPAQEAAVLRQRGTSRLAEDDLTDLIARIAAGQSYSSISDETGISRNTVRKVAAMVPTEPEPEAALA